MLEEGRHQILCSCATAYLEVEIRKVLCLIVIINFNKATKYAYDFILFAIDVVFTCMTQRAGHVGKHVLGTMWWVEKTRSTLVIMLMVTQEHGCNLPDASVTETAEGRSAHAACV